MDRQRQVVVSPSELGRFWERVRRALRLPRDSVTIWLVPNAQISRWNREFRGKRGPTDVLSFPARSEPPVRSASGNKPKPRRIASTSFPTPPGGESYLGDIAIAPAVARQNARRLGRTVDQELRILMLHGALHLAGYDHETDHGEMDRLERRVRRRLGLS